MDAWPWNCRCCLVAWTWHRWRLELEPAMAYSDLCRKDPGVDVRFGREETAVSMLRTLQLVHALARPRKLLCFLTREPELRYHDRFGM